MWILMSCHRLSYKHFNQSFILAVCNGVNNRYQQDGLCLVKLCVINSKAVYNG